MTRSDPYASNANTTTTTKRMNKPIATIRNPEEPASFKQRQMILWKTKVAVWNTTCPSLTKGFASNIIDLALNGKTSEARQIALRVAGAVDQANRPAQPAKASPAPASAQGGPSLQELQAAVLAQGEQIKQLTALLLAQAKAQPLPPAVAEAIAEPPVQPAENTDRPDPNEQPEMDDAEPEETPQSNEPPSILTPPFNPANNGHKNPSFRAFLASK